MLQYVCDWCGKVKKASDVWRLGIAAEQIGVVSARREVNILSSWNDTTAVHPLAVHFCSETCKDKYMAELFRDRAAS
jgi:hypothetical protein